MVRPVPAMSQTRPSYGQTRPGSLEVQQTEHAVSQWCQLVFQFLVVAIVHVHHTLVGAEQYEAGVDGRHTVHKLFLGQHHALVYRRYMYIIIYGGSTVVIWSICRWYTE